MTKLMKFAAAAMLFVAAQNANAISLRFKFKVFSSGPAIYACNAGLIHAPSEKQVCYFEGTQNACTPDQNKECTNGEVCHTRCVCTSAGGGEYLMDYMKGTTSTWNAATDGWSWNTTATTKQAGQSNYATLVPDADVFKHQIKELSFNLGSELYGAKYFVDICYRGPQIEYFADNVNANYTLLAQATASDFIANGVNPGDNSREGLEMNPATIKYTQIAGVKVQAVTVCDLQGVGDYKYAHNGSSANSGEYNTVVNEAYFNSLLNPTAAGKSGEYYIASNNVLINSQANLINNVWINLNATKSPRFCRVRYIFTETNASEAKPNLRKWQRHGAEMCTYTRINEAEAETTGLQ